MFDTEIFIGKYCERSNNFEDFDVQKRAVELVTFYVPSLSVCHCSKKQWIYRKKYTPWKPTAVFLISSYGLRFLNL